MERQKLLDELSARLKEAVEASPVKDVEKNLRAVLTSVFSRLDLVTREEFDIQRQVLARTRAKLDALERKLAEMEGAGPGDKA
jgi:BMFP domain-containing protein YqiC